MASASKALIAILLACQWAGVESGFAASAYPERAIRLVVGFPAGGSSDAIARIVQPNVEKQLGQRWSLKTARARAARSRSAWSRKRHQMAT